MISRIELTNFMSHASTVIEPAPGLTVLIGPNNVGKSAVVAALQILCYNENSTYVLRHGERECSVQIQTDEGHLIEWRRKTSPSYIIDAQIFDRLRSGGLPDELHRALRMSKVDAAGEADFDVHFGTQKSPIFLLNNSASVAARFFASSSDAIRLLTMQKRHKEKLSAAQREKHLLEIESRQLNAELELLEPVVDLDRRLSQAEQSYVELIESNNWLQEARKHEEVLNSQFAAVVRCDAHAGALGALASPPELVPTEPLAKLISALRQEERNRDELSARADALRDLALPLEPMPTALLATLIGRVDGAMLENQAAVSQVALFALLALPPPLEDVLALAHLANELASCSASVELADGEHDVLSRLSNPPRLADSEAILMLIKALETADRDRSIAGREEAALRTLAAPPLLENERALARLLAEIATAKAQSLHWEDESKLLCGSSSPPILEDAKTLSGLLAKLDRALHDVRSSEAGVEQANSTCIAAAGELRAQAVGSQCPICGSALDPDRIVARAEAGLVVVARAHDHD